MSYPYNYSPKVTQYSIDSPNQYSPIFHKNDYSTPQHQQHGFPFNKINGNRGNQLIQRSVTNKNDNIYNHNVINNANTSNVYANKNSNNKSLVLPNQSHTNNYYNQQNQVKKPQKLKGQMVKSSIYDYNNLGGSLQLKNSNSVSSIIQNSNPNDNFNTYSTRKIARGSEIRDDKDNINLIKKNREGLNLMKRSQTFQTYIQHPQFSKKNSKGQEKQTKVIVIEEPQRPRKEHKDSINLKYSGRIQNNKKKFTIDSFQKIRQLGTGKYGHVYLVREKQTNCICALKKIKKKLLKQQQIIDQFIRQLKIQSYLNHPNIIKMYGFFDDLEFIYIILEVGTGGQLFHLLKKNQPLPESKVASYMRQVCEAVKQLHSLRIIHRDIKPQNIVLHDNVIKLCDFGWSVRQDSNLRTTFCGTPLYVCPQILKGQQYDQKIDIWSLGVMIYEMIIGDNPFKITKEQQLSKIIKDELKIPKYLTISKQVQHFIQICLKKNPNDRASIRQLVQSQFLKKYPDKQLEKNKMAGLC